MCLEKYQILYGSSMICLLTGIGIVTTSLILGNDGYLTLYGLGCMSTSTSLFYCGRKAASIDND